MATEERIRGHRAIPAPKIARRVPEVIQTSNLDCGPAALAAMLEGLGQPACYEELRELCATDVDGTSIDVMETVAVAAGVDAEQMVVPAEHVLALPAAYLPAIAVTALPDGFTHFVVIWSQRGHRYQIMDPAHGRRWVSSSRLLAELYRHGVTVPAAAWREWAGSDVFTTALHIRMSGLGIPAADIERDIDSALADPGVEGLAGLDAAIRHCESTGARPAGHLESVAVTDADFSCVSEPGGQVRLRGAVIVRGQNLIPGSADPDLIDRLNRPSPALVTIVARILRRPKAAAAALAGVAVLSALTYVAETVLLQTVLDSQAELDDVTAGRIAAVMVLAAVCTLLAMWFTCQQGRRIEELLRYRITATVALLPDSWIRSRPVSDLAERGHLLYRVRDLPGQFYQLIFAICTILASSFVLCFHVPAAIGWVVLLTAACVGGPAVAVRAAAERDLRLRTLAGGLTRYTEDALLGAEAVHSSRGATALRHEHLRTLTHWRAAGRSLVAVSAAARAGVNVLTVTLGCAVITVIAADGETGWTVLAGLLMLLLIDAGTQLADLLRTAPVTRSVLGRIAAWLRTVELAEAPPPAEHEQLTQLRGITIRDASVTMGAAQLLRNITLDIPPGAHVAVVGPSGGGKSTLLGLILGIIPPSAGTAFSDGGTDDIAWVAAETRIWNTDLLDNVRYGDQSNAPNAVDRLASAEFLADASYSDHGTPQALGDGGRRLSDGQVQRIRIARALGRPEAKLVVLDEPFQGLERDRRRRLMNALRSQWADSTLICATHDVDDTTDFDMVIVMEGGSVVEFGNPAELRRGCNAYQRMLELHDTNGYAAKWRRVHMHEMGTQS